MICIYFKPNSGLTLIKTKAYFEKNRIEYKIQSLTSITLKEIKTFFKMSPNLEFILNREIIKKLDWNIKFNKLLKEMKENPTMFKNTIVVDYKNQIIITGYSEDKLDMFLRHKGK